MPRHGKVVRRSPRARFLAAIVAFVVLDLAGAAAAVQWARLPDGVPPWTPDAIVVFYGDDATTALRVEAGVVAWKRTGARALFMVGGFRGSAVATGSAAMAQEAVRRGAPAAIVRHDDASFDTRSNLDAVAAYAVRSGSRRIVFVSDPLHLKRIVRNARHRPEFAALDVAAMPAPYAGIAAAWGRAHAEAIAGAADVLLPDRVEAELLRALRLPHGVR